MTISNEGYCRLDAGAVQNVTEGTDSKFIDFGYNGGRRMGRRVPRVWTS